MIARKYLAHFINTSTTGTGKYERLGKDLEEFKVEMGGNITKTANILGETSVNLDKYEKTSAVEPYKAEEGTDLFKLLQSIVDEEKTLDDVVTDVVHVHLWETATAGAYPAYKEKAIIEVTSYGGNTEALQIPFNLHYTGERTKGTFSLSTTTFTPTVTP